MAKKRKKLKATVEKVIKPTAVQPEKVQLNIHDGEELYREVRIKNEVANEQGEKAKLKEGAKVDVIVEADSNATQKVSEKG